MWVLATVVSEPHYTLSINVSVNRSGEWTFNIHKIYSEESDSALSDIQSTLPKCTDICEVFFINIFNMIEFQYWAAGLCLDKQSEILKKSNPSKYTFRWESRQNNINQKL